GGMILDQRAVAGQHGVAMEVGHIIIKPQGRLCGCGNRGCMEQYASASGVSLTYFESSGRHESALTIAELAQAGNQDAMQAYELAGISLAQALAQVQKVLDVSQVVIGGGMRAAWPLMADAFAKQLDEDLVPVLRGQICIHLSELGDQAGMLGAAMLARDCIQA
ncbi:MAG: ROK family protein, partial [Fluviibacter sp.]